MPYVVTCTFREPAKTYFLDPGDLELHTGSIIVGETARGIELGKVKFVPREVPDDKIVPPLRSALRLATPEDLQQDAENKQREIDLLPLVRECIAFYDLPMKPIKVELMFDLSKMYFFYESEERVDFRDLLRDLSTTLEMRMQFQQVTA